MSDHEKLSQIELENGVFETRITRKFSRRKPYAKRNPGIIEAVIPGVISEINKTSGSPVKRGDTVIILEAMKMLNRIMAPVDGTVKTVRVAAGEKVSKGQVLLEIE